MTTTKQKMIIKTLKNYKMAEVPAMNTKGNTANPMLKFIRCSSGLFML